jgi:DNA-directed RNA polymerase subunit RPC12/RpoP
MATHDSACPYCKEGIKADAVKCKHCGSAVADPIYASSG